MGLYLQWSANTPDRFEGKDFPEEMKFRCHYGEYYNFRTSLLKAAKTSFADVWETLLCKDKFDKDRYEAERDKLSEENPGLCLFVCHSDCDGEFYPDECKVIYKALSNICVDKEWSEYLDRIAQCFKYCADHNAVMLYC